MKQTASFYLKLPLKPAFCRAFFVTSGKFKFYFWKDKSLLVLNLFIPEYLDRILPFKEIKEGFSVKLPDWKSFWSFFVFLFCLRWKLNKTQAAQIFKQIRQNIRAYFRSKKKSGLIEDSENIFEYWKESEQSKVLANKLGLFQIQLGV